MTFNFNWSPVFFIGIINENFISSENIILDELSPDNVPKVFLNYLKNNKIIQYEDEYYQDKNFTTNLLSSVDRTFVIYFFLHTKDFHGVSKSHFKLNTTNEESLLNKCGDLKFYAFEGGDKNKKIEQFVFRFVWFTKEERSCTVYPTLKSALGKYSIEKDAEKLMQELHHLWEIHDDEFRNTNREKLFKKFFEQSNTEQIDTLDFLI